MELICEQCGIVEKYCLWNGRCERCHHEATGKGIFIDCVECGKPWYYEFPDYEPFRERIALGLCTLCHLWTVRAAVAYDPCSVRVAGKHYWIMPDGEGPLGGLFQGFGGKEFIVEFYDGRRITTKNLWLQGEIPEHFRLRLPNNARFV